MKTNTPPTENFVSAAERKAFAAVGRIGGKATFRKHGKKYMSDLAKKGAAARWAKSKKVIKKNDKRNKI